MATLRRMSPWMAEFCSLRLGGVPDEVHVDEYGDPQSVGARLRKNGRSRLTGVFLGRHNGIYVIGVGDEGEYTSTMMYLREQDMREDWRIDRERQPGQR